MTLLYVNHPLDWGGDEVHPPPGPPLTDTTERTTAHLGARSDRRYGIGQATRLFPWRRARPPQPPKPRPAALRSPRPPTTPNSGRRQPRAALRLDVRREPVATRGPRALQATLHGSTPRAFPAPPAAWTGSLPEWAVQWALTQEGLVEGIDFFYQSPAFGGRNRGPGGLVVDFFLPELGIALNVQGLFWHYTNTADQARDQLQQAQLGALGTLLILIDEDDALARPRAVVQAALRGESWARLQF